jgi:DNA topoisomerase-1
MVKNLVIVESPAKAKTIEKFLGKEFTVKSCYGHIRDLKKGDDAIDVKNNFTPYYEVSPDKKQVVSELKKLAKEAETVWLASDEDREGEAISWHLAETLNLDQNKTKRIVFHEITKPAILKAIENPRVINKNLVDAQQARRILDRLVGFELSPVLWKKIKSNLSAGRVQSVAVKLIVEREREINAFQPESHFKITAHFKSSGVTFQAELNKKFKTAEEAEAFLKKCINNQFTISDLEVKPAKKSPAPPFTTSTLQQEASRKLGYGVATTMSIAQKLYENGYITYMRTDSVNLSDLAIASAKKQIIAQFGSNFSKTRKYITKNASAQEAHEAIRPTYFENITIEGTKQEQKLYDLIWKRTIASQMADAELEKTVVTIAINGVNEVFTATGEVLKFEGFLKVYLEGKDDEGDEENSGMLPALHVGEKLIVEKIEATERFSKAPPRYTEASLVKKLEELGIGRPSTYAPTISTILKRGYVIKEDREGKERNYTQLTLQENTIKKTVLVERYGSEKSKLFPSNLGIVVTDFLSEHFNKIMDYGFTASVEKEFDEIANGYLQWSKMIDKFYGPFHKDVEKTISDANRQSGERLLGTDPTTGKNIYAKIGRYGPLVQMGENNDENKPRYASLRPGQLIETITLEESLELFKLPRLVGIFEGKEVKANIGKFGPYLMHDNKFYSIPKEEDVYTLTAEKAAEIILAKREADANKIIKVFDEDKEIKILNGRWGPYIAKGKNNYKIPKGTAVDGLTYSDVIKLMQLSGKPNAKLEEPVKKAANKKVSVKKAAAKKTATKKK